jgi:hypothetical protein
VLTASPVEATVVEVRVPQPDGVEHRSEQIEALKICAPQAQTITQFLDEPAIPLEPTQPLRLRERQATQICPPVVFAQPELMERPAGEEASNYLLGHRLAGIGAPTRRRLPSIGHAVNSDTPSPNASPYLAT